LIYEAADASDVLYVASWMNGSVFLLTKHVSPFEAKQIDAELLTLPILTDSSFSLNLRSYINIQNDFSKHSSNTVPEARGLRALK